jgi:hypothetical protein
MAAWVRCNPITEMNSPTTTSEQYSGTRLKEKRRIAGPLSEVSWRYSFGKTEVSR